MKHLIWLVIFTFTFAAGQAYANDIKGASAADIEQAEKYLQDMKTAQARFVQTTHDGTQLVGTFYLNRPGKLRFDYDPPIDSFVVADGMFIYFYDADLESQTNAPIKATLANFFLRKNFSFTDDLMVQDAKFAGNLLQIRVVQSDEPDAGSITFAFSKDPFELKKWRIIDQQGMITEIELFYLKKGMKHPHKLFYYIDPKMLDRKPTYND